MNYRSTEVDEMISRKQSWVAGMLEWGTANDKKLKSWANWDKTEWKLPHWNNREVIKKGSLNSVEEQQQQQNKHDEMLNVMKCE